MKNMTETEKKYGMSKKDIERIIVKEQKRIEKLESKIADIQTDIKCCIGAIDFWKNELQKKDIDNTVSV